MQKNSLAFIFILGIPTLFNLKEVGASEINKSISLTQIIAAAQPNVQLASSAQYNEQKFLADRCRLIKSQAFSTGGGFGSGNIHLAIYNIENFLYSVGTQLAFQMLNDLQRMGYNGFNEWCSKYGV